NPPHSRSKHPFTYWTQAARSRGSPPKYFSARSADEVARRLCGASPATGRKPPPWAWRLCRDSMVWFFSCALCPHVGARQSRGVRYASVVRFTGSTSCRGPLGWGRALSCCSHGRDPAASDAQHPEPGQCLRQKEAGPANVTCLVDDRGVEDHEEQKAVQSAIDPTGPR